jgi:hypothetical protein
MKIKDELVNTFGISSKIDNIPVMLGNPERIMDNFEFAMRIDPFLFIELLVFSNGPTYGFSGEIMRIEEIPLLIEKNILTAILKSNSVLDVKKKWYNQAAFSFLLYPVYLTVAGLLMEPDWLGEEDLNRLTFMPAGLTLKKIFFPEEYEKIRMNSIHRNISLLESESKLNFPSSILLANIFFSIKNIPVIIPYYTRYIKLENANEKINYIITLTDVFLQSNFFRKAGREEKITDLLKFLPGISLDQWYDELVEKTNLLWKNLIDDDIRANLTLTLEYCYRYHKSVKLNLRSALEIRDRTLDSGDRNLDLGDIATESGKKTRTRRQSP